MTTTNDNSDKEKIIRKIKKLFRLSKSPNEHEAQVALMKAKELLNKYNISQSELDIEFIKTEYNPKNIITKEIGIRYLKLPIYKDILAAYIAHFFDCESMKEVPVYDDETKEIKKCITFVGFPTDVEIAIFAYQFTLNFIEKRVAYYRKKFKKFKKTLPKKFKNSYTIGFIEELDSKLQLLKAYKIKNDSINSEISTPTPEDKIIAVKETALKEYLENEYALIDDDLNAKPSKIEVNNNVLYLGKQDAIKKFNINVPVDNNNDNNNFTVQALDK